MRKYISTLAVSLPLSFVSHAAMAQISYSDILADPDNVTLNQSYAFEQMDVGNPKGALAAIERVLTAEPANLPARLFRANVLMALGSDLQAEAELRALAILPLPQAQKTRVANMLERIRRRGQTFQSYASIALGFLDSDNVNNYPDSGNVTARGVENTYTTYDIEGNSFTTPLDDQALSANIALNSIYKTNSQVFDQIFFNLAHNNSSQGDTGYLDYKSNNLSGGMRFIVGEFFVQPYISYSDIENDLDSLGNLSITNYNLAINRKFGAKIDVGLSAAQSVRAYEGDKDSNDGDTLSYTLQGSYQVLPRMRVGLSANFQDVTGETNKDLTKEVMNYGGSVTYVPAGGHVLNLSYQTGSSEHANIYSASVGQNSDGKKREDDTIRYNASYSVSGAKLSDMLSDMRFSLNYGYSETDSNFTDFINDKTTIGLSINYSKAF